MCGGFPAQAICPLWGAKPTRFCFQPTRVSSSSSTHFWEAFGFCPTSARNAPHACLISSWAKAWCITTHTCSSGRGMPCTQVLATKPCGCRANIGYKASPWPEVKIPKVDNI